MACKGICDRFEAKRLPKGGRYINGQKRCMTCSIFIDMPLMEKYSKPRQNESLYCACCNAKLRSRPKNIILREKQDLYMKETKVNNMILCGLESLNISVKFGSEIK